MWRIGVVLGVVLAMFVVVASFDGSRWVGLGVLRPKGSNVVLMALGDFVYGVHTSAGHDCCFD